MLAVVTLWTHAVRLAVQWLREFPAGSKWRRGMNEKVAIQEVARTAGVSKATVSRVLNDKPDVDEATRQRVLAAISSLGYIPNQAALTLARRAPAPQFASATHSSLP